MEQQGLTRPLLLEKINKLEEELDEPSRTTHVSLVYGFNKNYWRPKLVKKISAVIGVNLLPYIPVYEVRDEGKRKHKKVKSIFDE